MFRELNILRIFFESPTREFNVREVARILKMSPATSSKILKKLSEKKILLLRKERNLDLYKANLEDDFYRDLKLFYSLRKIKDSGLLEELNSFYLKPTIILFGSFVFGLDTENSDIDLLIISEKTDNFKQLNKFEKKLNRRIQIFAVKQIKDLKNRHLINNILNGIVIQGELKWI